MHLSVANISKKKKEYGGRIPDLSSRLNQAFKDYKALFIIIMAGSYKCKHTMRINGSLWYKTYRRKE